MVALVVSLALPNAAAAQVARDGRPAVAPVPAGTAAIAGQVVAADTGRPLRRARVVASGGAPKMSRTVETDDQGGFRLAGLNAGEYTLSATRGGFVQSIFGQKQPGSGRPGTPLTLAVGETISKVVLPVARGGVVTGQIVDEVGEPAFGIAVRAYRWERRNGERVLQSAGSGSTDDRGIYRIPALLPGEYVLVAQPGSGDIAFKFEEGTTYVRVIEAIKQTGDARSVEFVGATIHTEEPPLRKTHALAAVYYPGTLQSASASSVPIGPGEERAGIDFQLQVVPVGTISGVVTGPAGPMAGAGVQLIDQGQIAGAGVRTARARADGAFTFSNVPPGQYSLVSRAIPKGGKALEASGREAAEFLASARDAAKAATIAAAIGAVEPMWGMLDINADGRDLNDVQLVLQPGLTLSGRVAFSGGSGSPGGTTRMSLIARPVGAARSAGETSALPPAPVDANGRFTIRGLTPGRYTIAVAAGAPAGFSLQSAIVGGQDVLDFPLELTGRDQIPDAIVTLSDRTSELTGVAVDSTGRPTSAVTVIAFAADDRFWTPASRRIEATRPSADGRYVFRNLPAGDYRVAVVDDVEPGQWFEPEYLRSLAKFTTHSVR